MDASTPAGYGSLPDFERFALRQTVAMEHGPVQRFAAQPLLDYLSRAGRYRFTRIGDGAQILAISESALEEARDSLRRVYGTLLHFGTPCVHSQRDPVSGMLMEPVVFVRVELPRMHFMNVIVDLKQRGAAIQDVRLVRNSAVVRAEVNAGRWLGGESRIQQLTGGRAQLRCWITRYAPAAGPESAQSHKENAP